MEEEKTMSCLGKKYSFINIHVSISDVEEGYVHVCDNEKVATLRCPCGCNTIIYLNLLEEYRPRWKVNGNSITPSIQRTVGCMSHFTITNGITH